MSNTHFDYFVIGAGSGGVRSARIAAQHGAKVGIAECSDLGGTCVNLGCVPKKLLAYGSDFHAAIDDARAYGWKIPENISFSWKTLIENKNKEISRLNGIYKTLLENAGVELFHGYASFTAAKTLEISGRVITADNILIAVGGKPRLPQIEGAEHMLTSDDIFHLEDLPRDIVIAGGGYIGLEFAHIFAGVGANVTLLHRGDQVLRGFDQVIRSAIETEIKKQGIDLHLHNDVTKVEKKSDGKYTVHTSQEKSFECGLVLAAIGRMPNTGGLCLDKAGIRCQENGQIKIDHFYHTSAKGIFAVGDVANQNHLTPVAIQEGHVLADRLFGGMEERSVNYNYIATAVFSEPPIGTVGMTEEQALRSGHDVKIFETNFRPLKHTLTGRDERTYMKLVVDRASDKVLGMHMLGADAPEIIQGFAVALNCGATKADLDRTMAIHPTSAEEFVTMRQEVKR